MYTGTGDQVVLLDKDATLSGGWDISFTTQSGTSIIDGDEARRGVIVNSGVTAVVERFTAQHGYTGDANGGGIHNSGTLTLTNCTINDNYAYYDGYDDHGRGGIYNIGALALIGSTVKNNTATDSGGGIYSTSGSSTVIEDSRIYANEAFNNEGGGIHFDYYSHLSMSRSWVVGNAALGNDVGGIGVSGGSAYIENSVIAGNTAQGTGGGLWFNGGGPYRVVNSHIVGNEATYEGSAITGNSVRVEVTNTLIISNTGNTGIDDQGTSGAEFLLNYCDTYGNGPDGTSTVTIIRTNCLGVPPEDGLDPLMLGGTLPDGVGPAFADQWLSYSYRLLPGSPAIDAGTAIGAPATDIEGNPRDATPNMGAYENKWDFITFLPLILRNLGP
jgi:predicted outer membrane repeat protein